MRTASAAAALLLLAAAPAIVQAEECGAGGCDSTAGADDAALLQVSRKAGEEQNSRLRPAAAAERDLAAEERDKVALMADLHKYAFGGRSKVKVGKERSWLCPGWDVLSQSQVAGFAKYFNGTNQVAWWTTPQPPHALLEATRNQLTPIQWDATSLEFARRYAVWSKGGAVDVLNKMYEVTKARSTFNKVPEFLRGVFWMKGNGLPEVLTVLQQGIWIEQENTFIAPVTPFSWAWPLSTPAKPPLNGIAYTGLPKTAISAGLGLTLGGVGISFKFSSCPSGETYCTKTSPHNDKAYAYMQTHSYGDIRYHVELGQMAETELGSMTGMDFTGYDIAGRFTLQAMRDNDTTHWKRTCDWGISGCTLIEMGSYDLVQVIDGKGQPVQPWYDEYLQFIGDVEVAVWSGFTNESVQAEAGDFFANTSEAAYQQHQSSQSSQPWYSWMMALGQESESKK